MITVSVTSDSSLPELRVAERFISDIIKLRIGDDMALGVANVDKRWKPSLNEIAEHFKVPLTDELRGNSVDTLIVDEVFNPTELAEAEQLGKPVCSTVVADQSSIALGDSTVSISLPEPTSVFGQAAQTTANVANPVAPVTESHAIDADGLTWDSRIHSSSRELNKDGTWRKRRGVNTDLVTQVEAELRGTLATNLGIPTSPIEVSAPQTVNTVSIVDESASEPRVPDPTQSTPMTFHELLDAVTKAMVAGQLTQARITEALKSVGLEALPHLLGNPALIPAFREALGGVV